MQPLVSVVIPTCNRPQLLRRAVASVLAQTYCELECIAVDDASAGDTAAVLAAFDDKRIVFLRNKQNRGAPASRNRGIAEAHGEFIALLDDDDEWLPEKIEKQVRAFHDAEELVGVVYCGFEFVGAGNERAAIAVSPVWRGQVHEAMLESCVLGSPTPLVRKKYFAQAGLFDERLPSCQDWDMWIRLAAVCAFDFVPDVLARHYVHGRQISADLQAKIASRTVLLEKYRNDLESRPRILCCHLQRLAVLHALAGQTRDARVLLARSLRRRPGDVRAWVQLFLSAMPPLYRSVVQRRCTTKIGNTVFFY